MMFKDTHAPTQLLDRYFAEAVDGLSELILSNEKYWYNYVERLPTHLEITYTLAVFHQQVFNGGLHQYYLNGYGIFASLTVENLKTIGAFKSADVLRRSILIVNKANFSDPVFREMIYKKKILSVSEFEEQTFDELEELDSLYYTLDEDLQKLAYDYFKKLGLD